MTAPGTFVVSLDCEGKWGMADRIDSALDARLTDAKLREAYRRILSLFSDLRLPASFAFVGAFTLSPAERARLADWFEDVEIGGKNWLRHFRRQGEGRDGPLGAAGPVEDVDGVAEVTDADLVEGHAAGVGLGLDVGEGAGRH